MKKRNIIYLALIAVILLALAIYNIRFDRNFHENDRMVVIFIEVEATDEEIENFKQDIKDHKFVEEIVNYKTKEMVRDEMLLKNEHLKEIIYEYGDDLPFNPVLVLKIDNVRNVSNLVKELKEFDIIDSIVYNRKIE